MSSEPDLDVGRALDMLAGFFQFDLAAHGISVNALACRLDETNASIRDAVARKFLQGLSAEFQLPHQSLTGPSGVNMSRPDVRDMGQSLRNGWSGFGPGGPIDIFLRHVLAGVAMVPQPQALQVHTQAPPPCPTWRQVQLLPNSVLPPQQPLVHGGVVEGFMEEFQRGVDAAFLRLERELLSPPQPSTSCSYWQGAHARGEVRSEELRGGAPRRLEHGSQKQSRRAIEQQVMNPTTSSGRWHSRAEALMALHRHGRASLGMDAMAVGPDLKTIKVMKEAHSTSDIAVFRCRGASTCSGPGQQGSQGRCTFCLRLRKVQGGWAMFSSGDHSKVLPTGTLGAVTHEMRTLSTETDAMVKETLLAQRLGTAVAVLSAHMKRVIAERSAAKDHVGLQRALVDFELLFPESAIDDAGAGHNKGSQHRTRSLHKHMFNYQRRLKTQSTAADAPITTVWLPRAHDLAPSSADRPCLPPTQGAMLFAWSAGRAFAAPRKLPSWATSLQQPAQAVLLKALPVVLPNGLFFDAKGAIQGVALTCDRWVANAVFAQMNNVRLRSFDGTFGLLTLDNWVLLFVGES